MCTCTHNNGAPTDGRQRFRAVVLRCALFLFVWLLLTAPRSNRFLQLRTANFLQLRTHAFLRARAHRKLLMCMVLSSFLLFRLMEVRANKFLRLVSRVEIHRLQLRGRSCNGQSKQFGAAAAEMRYTTRKQEFGASAKAPGSARIVASSLFSCIGLVARCRLHNSRPFTTICKPTSTTVSKTRLETTPC